MTRVNLVPPTELHDQHLFAEWRELKMIPKSLARSLAAYGAEKVLEHIPPEYVLGKGHVSFFYDKGYYLTARYSQLCVELHRRGVNFDKTSLLDPDRVYATIGRRFQLNYTPTKDALILIRARIADRVAMKPSWYRHTRLLPQ
jgi:deoxyribonuclease (pyrimidine dimer)